MFQKHYKDIYDLPFYNWLKIREGKLEFLYKKEGVEINNYIQKEYLNEVYIAILQQFFDIFGKSKQYENELRLIGKIVDARLRFLEKQEKFLLNEITMLEAQLEQLKLQNIDQKHDINKELAYVSKESGILLNPKKTSVYDYYTLRKLLEDGTKNIN